MIQIGKNTHVPANTILAAAAITGMLTLNGCSVQKSLGAKTYHENMIALQSYISTLMTMSLAMGLVFEIPILSWLFAKLGFLSADFMRKYRKHAIVVILVVAAIITPTSDVFTLSLVSLPIWILYETSILLVSKIHN